MYNGLADAIEDLKSKGYRNLSSDKKYGAQIRDGKVPSDFKGMKLLETYRFEIGTSAGDESALYVIELADKSKGFLVISFGMYKDPGKSELIDILHDLDTSES
jgi:hypothetical protein